MHACIHAFIRTCAYVPACIRTCTHAYVHACMCMSHIAMERIRKHDTLRHDFVAQIYNLVHAFTYIHPQYTIHSHTRAHTYIHMCRSHTAEEEIRKHGLDGSHFCVCDFAHLLLHFTLTLFYVCIHVEFVLGMYAMSEEYYRCARMCVCVCVCVCARARARMCGMHNDHVCMHKILMIQRLL